MSRHRLVVALAVVGIAGATIGVSEGQSAREPSAAARSAALARFVPIAHGARRGIVLAGSVPGVGPAALYVPEAARGGRELRLVSIDSTRRSPGRYASAVHLASTGDQLIWDETTPPFAVVVSRASSPVELGRLLTWTQDALPLARVPDVPLVLRAGAGPLRHRSLESVLTAALQSPEAHASTIAARAVAPRRFSLMQSGPDGGTIWQGRIPGAAVPALTRQGLVYLPPDVDPARRYPLVVLLQGLRGSPFSFAGSLRLAAVADPLITSHALSPFIAVMPPAGLTPAFDGEWTGVWERYVVADVVPWASAHLPVERDGSDRVIAGYSAGGYGAVDLALRHPGLFGVAESWSGYFDAPKDGSLRAASLSVRDAHSPTLLVAREHAQIRAHGLRFLLSAGVHERRVLQATRRFGAELAHDRVTSRVLVTQGRHDARQWHAVLGPGLRYALSPDLTGR